MKSEIGFKFLATYDDVFGLCWICSGKRQLTPSLPQSSSQIFNYCSLPCVGFLLSFLSLYSLLDDAKQLRYSLFPLATRPPSLILHTITYITKNVPSYKHFPTSHFSMARSLSRIGACFAAASIVYVVLNSYNNMCSSISFLVERVFGTPIIFIIDLRLFVEQAGYNFYALSRYQGVLLSKFAFVWLDGVGTHIIYNFSFVSFTLHKINSLSIFSDSNYFVINTSCGV